MKINFNFQGNSNNISLSNPSYIELLSRIEDITNFQSKDINLIYEGRVLSTKRFELLEKCKPIAIQIGLKVLGGKGGFGSLLRGQAVTKKKFDNRDASRDLNGRRIRNSNNEEKLKEFVKKKLEEDKEIQEELKKFKEIQKSLQEQEKTQIIKRDSNENLEKWRNIFQESISEGLKRKRGKFINEVEDEAQKKVKFDGEEGLNSYFNSILSKSDKGNFVDRSETKEINQNQKKTAQEEFLNLDTPSKNQIPSTIDILKYKSSSELEEEGGEKLKEELSRLGLKCGGTVSQRAQRLWDVHQDPLLLFSNEYKAKKK